MNDDSIATHMYWHVLSVLLTGQKKKKKKKKKKKETSREEQLHFTDTQSDTNPEVSHNKLFCQSQWVAPACALHASESIRKKN